MTETIHPGAWLRTIVSGMPHTQDEIAAALGVSRFTLNQILNGRRGVTPNMALRMARVLDVDAAALLSMQNVHDLAAVDERKGDGIRRLPPLKPSPALPQGQDERNHPCV